MGQGSTELRTSKEFTIEDAVERLPPPPATTTTSRSEGKLYRMTPEASFWNYDYSYS